MAKSHKKMILILSLVIILILGMFAAYRVHASTSFRADQDLSMYHGNDLILMKNCQSFINGSNFSSKDTIDYSVRTKSRVADSNGKTDWNLIGKNYKPDNNDYVIVVGDTSTPNHSYAVLLVSSKDYQVRGYEPVK